MKLLAKIRLSLVVLLVAFAASEAAAFGCGWRWGCALLALWCVAAGPLVLFWETMRALTREALEKPVNQAVAEELRTARKTSGRID